MKLDYESSVQKILIELINKTPNVDNTKSRIFNIYGKHDILCVIYSDKLAETIDYFYSWIELIDGIIDYTKIIGFNWDDKFLINKRIPSSITLFKLNIGNKEKAIENETKLIDKIKSKVLEYKKINSNFDVEVNGTFGWYELNCIFFSDTYTEISDFLKELRCECPELIWETSTIPLINNQIKDKNMLIKSFIFVEPGEELNVEKWISNKNWKFFDKFGIFDYSIEFDKDPIINDSDKLFEVINKCPGIRNITSFLCFNSKHEKGPVKDREAVSVDTDEILNKYEELIENYSDMKRDNEEISLLKLKSYKSIVSMLNRIPVYKKVLPPFLNQMLDRALKSSNDLKTRLWFLTHIRYVLQQRLSGAGIASILGTQGGIYEQMGGYQRLLLSAEAMLFKTIEGAEKYFDSTDDFNIKDKGFLLEKGFNGFLVFDYRPEFSVVQCEFDFPHAIHLPITKYSPWYWIFIMHELGHAYYHSYDSVQKDVNKTYRRGIDSYHLFFKLLNLEKNEKDRIEKEFIGYFGDKEGLEDFKINLGKDVEADRFALNFIAKDTYFNILRDYFFKESSLDELFNENSFNSTDDFLKLIEFLAPSLYLKQKDHLNNKNEESKMKDILKKGEIVIDFDDYINFFSIINAYCSLPIKLRESPKCLTSLVLSLYNIRMSYN